MARGKFSRKRGGGRHFSRDIEAVNSADTQNENQDDKHNVSSSEGSENETSEDESVRRSKGNIEENLIEIENPNRVAKTHHKVADMANMKYVPTRREREEMKEIMEKRKEREMYNAGLTPEAKADLARLAEVRRRREEEAAKKKAEKEAKEEATKQKLAASGRKLDAVKS